MVLTPPSICFSPNTTFRIRAILPAASPSRRKAGVNISSPCPAKALCIFYHGAYEGLPVIVKHLCAYANKYQIPLKGTARHLYLEGPPQHKNPENFLTQVAVLVADDTL